jgi:hypothetical protein
MMRTPRTAKRLDALIAQPLATFRRSIGRLSVADLAALQLRIEVLTIAARWARGGHGLVRHRSRGELEKLGRRAEELRREIASRRVANPVRLLESDPPPRQRSWDRDERAA